MNKSYYQSNLYLADCLVINWDHRNAFHGHKVSGIDVKGLVHHSITPSTNFCTHLLCRINNETEIWVKQIVRRRNIRVLPMIWVQNQVWREHKLIQRWLWFFNLARTDDAHSFKSQRNSRYPHSSTHVFNSVSLWSYSHQLSYVNVCPNSSRYPRC